MVIICGLEGAYATMIVQSSGNSPENITNSIQCHKIASGGACGGLTIIYAPKTRFRKVILKKNLGCICGFEKSIYTLGCGNVSGTLQTYRADLVDISGSCQCYFENIWTSS